MFKIIISVLFVACCATTSLAQSSSTGSDDWAGFYLGGNGFASSDKSDAEATVRIAQVSTLFVATRGIVVVPSTLRPFEASRRETNWSGGGQAGYQWQAGRFVFGAEGDFNPFPRTVSLSQTQKLPVTLLTPDTSFEVRRDVRLSREFSLRARMGVAFGKTLLYGTVGYGQARVRVSSIDTFINPGGATAACSPPAFPCTQANLGASGPVVTTASEEQNMGGWTGGLGVARRLGAPFSIGFEYRRTDFGSKAFTLSNQTRVNTGPEARGTDGVAGLSGGVETGPTRVSIKSDSFSVRFNFHF